jgi:hypothetical protein
MIRFKNILIGLTSIIGGPIITILLYLANERPENWSKILFLVKYILGVGLISVIICAIIYLKIFQFWRAFIITVIAIEVLYVVSLITALFVFDRPHIEETIMWLPVIVFFLVGFTIPMACLISYGTSRLLLGIRRKPR